MHKKKLFLSYLITFVIALVLSFLIASYRGFAFQNSVYLNAWALSDGTFVTGLLLTGVGALVWVSTTGFFDIFSYGFHSLLLLFTAFKKPQDHMNFYDYQQEKKEKRGATPVYIFVVGVLFVLLSLLFLAVYKHAL